MGTVRTFYDAAALVGIGRTLRIGVTGLARSGKTALLTSLAANLLAAGAGLPALPALTERLNGRPLRVQLAPAGAESLPRFDYARHLQDLAADPPAFPVPTDAVSVLALDLTIGRSGLFSALPSQSVRLELVDYPGEWLLDIPLLGQDFSTWSAAVLRRLEQRPEAVAFNAFAHALPASAARDEALAAEGHRLYAEALRRMRREAGLALLQPGRFLMPAPGPTPPWMGFFPANANGGLGGLLRERYERYRMVVREQLASPGFANIERLVVLADLLGALHAGGAAFADAQAALGQVSDALRWQTRPTWLPDFLSDIVGLFGGIDRVAFVASKSDHVADRQRGNLAALVGRLTDAHGVASRAFSIASVRCTEDVVWTLDGRPVSAVRGRVVGEARAGRSYPGEVPDRPPGPTFWAHPFLALPDFEPLRLPLAGRGGVPHIALDDLLVFLLEDVL